MAEYLLNLSSRYDEHLGETNGGTQVCITQNSILATLSSVREQGIRSNLSFINDYNGPGYYFLYNYSGNFNQGRYDIVGTEFRQYKYLNTATTAVSSATFTILESSLDQSRVYWTGNLYLSTSENNLKAQFFTETGDSQSILTSIQNSTARNAYGVVYLGDAAQVYASVYVNSPVPGVAYVEDPDNSFTGVCYNDVTPMPPTLDLINFPESAGTFTWTQVGFTEAMYNSICDFMFQRDPRKDILKWKWCIGNVGNYVPGPENERSIFSFYRPDANGVIDVNNAKYYLRFDFVDSNFEKSFHIKFYWETKTVEISSWGYDPG